MNCENTILDNITPETIKALFAGEIINEAQLKITPLMPDGSDLIDFKIKGQTSKDEL